MVNDPPVSVPIHASFPVPLSPEMQSGRPIGQASRRAGDFVRCTVPMAQDHLDNLGLERGKSSKPRPPKPQTPRAPKKAAGREAKPQLRQSSVSAGACCKR